MESIVCLNPYNLGTFHEDHPASPDQFFYGLNYLFREGYRVQYADASSNRLLNNFGNTFRWTRLPLGDVACQIAALPLIKEADVIYTPCDNFVNALCYAKAVGLIRTKIVCLAHHPISGSRRLASRLKRRTFTSVMLKGIDAYPSLSKSVADDLNELSGRPDFSRVLSWGPDLSFYPPYSPPGSGVIAAGRTGRDFLTFGRAATRLNAPTTIVCPSSYVTDEFRSFNSNVQVFSHENPIHFTYQQLVPMFSKSLAMAIPMQDFEGLCGLTSLVDALAMGRAVLMTRNPRIDIDIEAEGIGYWIDPGDVKGWVDAMQRIVNSPEEATAMGVRARELAEDRFNSSIFGRQICDVISGVLGHCSDSSRKTTQSC